ncbi:MAG TPA: PaaI family thioesterase [Candidatus Dormibacteraeota bacterium]|nr:PaaI family thioesterase [Candidatus Dormibacteraeota bacterium]
MGGDDPAKSIAARMERAGIYELLGIRLLNAGSGSVELEVVCDQRHANVDGAVHGGFLCLVADTAMGFAVRSDLDPSWQNRTVNLNIDWFSAAKVGDRITARAVVDHASNRFRWASVELMTEGGVVCKAHSLNSVRPPAST